MKHQFKFRSISTLICGAALICVAAAGAEQPAPAEQAVLKDGTIAYALNEMHWAVYPPGGRNPCTGGANDGPREQFKALYPDINGKTVVDTQLRWEVESWFPTTAPDLFVYHEPEGQVAQGLNLDGKVGPHDFTSPEGEAGIDNEMFRALGCINGFRDAQGPNDFFLNARIIKDPYNRIVIQLSDVKNLQNSENVTVTFFRGLDLLKFDAAGKGIIPGGTERVDFRWGARYIQRFHGKIVNGVLITEPGDLGFPWGEEGVPVDEYMHAARFQLKLTPTHADGLIGGYNDIETWYLAAIKSHSTHDESYGQLSTISLYKAYRRLADAYPDATGANKAISSALRVQFTEVVLLPASKAQLAEFKPPRLPTPYAGAPVPRAASEEINERKSAAIAGIAN